MDESGYHQQSIGPADNNGPRVVPGSQRIPTQRPVGPDWDFARRRGYVPKPCFIASLGCFLLALTLCGCGSTRSVNTGRHFDFGKDTFSYANELVWEYHYDSNGKWVTHRREPRPSYSQHCFVAARSVLQFFENARFDAGLPVADEATYRRLVRRVVSTDPRHPLPEWKKIVIPGYSNLRSFSRAEEPVLKAECGSGWESYFQRGHWRMIFPFSRREQQRMANQLVAHLGRNQPAVVHVVRFPQLTINHAIILFDSKETADELQFMTYDPNNPEEPVVITYDKARRTFNLPANNYFPGGRVDVYEVYHRWDY